MLRTWPAPARIRVRTARGATDAGPAPALVDGAGSAIPLMGAIAVGGITDCALTYSLHTAAPELSWLKIGWRPRRCC